MGLTLAAFILYLVIMIAIGLVCSRYFTNTMSDFYLGGRKMNDWVVALSAVVSGRSSWLILGVTGIAFARGISAVWAVAGYIIVELFMFIFLGTRLRRYTAKVDAITLPDFYESRFKDGKHLLRITSVIIIVIFMVFYISAQLTAGGKTFCETFKFHDEKIAELKTQAEEAKTSGDMELSGKLEKKAASLDKAQNLYSVILTAIIVLAYTALGGFVAVSLTDMLQAFFMIFGLVVLPIVATINFGGLGNLFEAIGASGGSTMLDPWALGFGGIIGYLGIGLGSPGNPHILVRYMSIRKPEMLRKSALIGTVWNVLMAWGAIFIGLVAKAQVESGMVLTDDPERIFPCLAAQHMNPFIVGLMIASVFAAIMSTVDSQLLVASSAISRDIYQRIIKGGIEITEKRMVFLSRIVIFILIVLASVIATIAIEYPDKAHIVFWFVLFAWGGMGASFGTTVLLALFWKGTTKLGVFAGMVSGTLITIIWKTSATLSGLIYELIPSFFISFVLVVVVSLLTKPPEGIDDEFLSLTEPDKED